MATIRSMSFCSRGLTRRSPIATTITKPLNTGSPFPSHTGKSFSHLQFPVKQPISRSLYTHRTLSTLDLDRSARVAPIHSSSQSCQIHSLGLRLSILSRADALTKIKNATPNVRYLQRRDIRTNWYQGDSGNRGGSSWQRFDRLFTPQSVVYGIIGINVGVFLLWQYAIGNTKTYGDLNLLRFMQNNFLVSSDAVLRAGRWWTLITSNFSHNEAIHLFVNMFVLYNFGPAVIDIIGSRQFLALYMAAGLVSSLASVLHSKMSPARSHTSTLGASGAITGCTLVFAATYPRVPIYLFMVIPVPAALAIGGFVAYDVFRGVTGTGGRTDTAAHIGGAMAGFAYWWFKVRRGRIGRF
ncbi:hypothetical protein DFS34DRAFT_612968 [Phlyctochytrium arcticum]|nr:hypothetical protein DFS34DRAFT_612968 [Phlyctochytrium arcticum]